MDNIHTYPDLFRAVLISLSAFLFGLVLFGAFQAWRDRYEPPPRRLPLAAVLIFLVGYLSLLVQVAYGRWINLGEPRLTAASLGAFVALMINVVAIGVIVYYRRDAQTAGLVEIRTHGKGYLAMFLRMKIFDNVLDDEQHMEVYGTPHPGRRRADKMCPLELMDHIEDRIRDPDMDRRKRLSD